MDSVAPNTSGIDISTHGHVTRAGGSTYGTWDLQGNLSYDPAAQRVFGSGTLLITLDGTLADAGADLNLERIASNFLHDVPLQIGGEGDTGDMRHAMVRYAPNGDSRDFSWFPPALHSHFPADSSHYLRIEVLGQLNTVDTQALGEPFQIEIARKPTLKLTYTSATDPIFSGLIWDASEGQNFAADNVGINHLLRQGATSSKVFTLPFSFESTVIPPPPPEFTPAELEAAAQRALHTILALQDPNTGLVDSYSDDAEEDPNQNGRRGHLFDQAVVLILLTHAGQSDPNAAYAAEVLAQRLIHLQDPNTGCWSSSYNTRTLEEVDPPVEAGPNAWAGYALLYYASTLNRPNRGLARSSAANFAHYAIETLRDPNTLGRYDYYWGYKSDAYLEGKFYSTEINLDMWWLLASLGVDFTHVDPLDGLEKTMKWWAARLWDELTDPNRGYWNESEERWNRGPNDARKAEDTQTWGSVTALFAGDGTRRDGPLDFVLDPANGLLQEFFANETRYFGELALTGMEDNVDPNLVPGSCSETIWNQGSGHTVCALQYADRSSEATRILNSLVASEEELPMADANDPADPNHPPLRGWPHSLHSIDSSCEGSHFGPNDGVHVGASAWVYFAVASRSGDLLPYRLNTSAT
jgi:hypothetical protein